MLARWHDITDHGLEQQEESCDLRIFNPSEWQVGRDGGTEKLLVNSFLLLRCERDIDSTEYFELRLFQGCFDFIE